MNPFDLADDVGYRMWRDAKLAGYPRRVEDLIVEVADPRRLTAAEREAIAARVRRSNMAIYASRHTEPDKTLPRRMGEQLGLVHLDHNMLADEDAISTLTVAEGNQGVRGEYIPYTNRPIRWHTDGYYNPPERRICGMILHCVQPAAEGGENRLLDHEIAYILLRDQDPAHIEALSAAEAMVIPPRMDEDGIARAAQGGPVFSLLADGALHMRYTARTKSIEWKDTPQTLAAIKALETILADEAYVLQCRLEAGMGLICNNVLHDRSAFNDRSGQKRLIYRARYYDRMRFF